MPDRTHSYFFFRKCFREKNWCVIMNTLFYGWRWLKTYRFYRTSVLENLSKVTLYNDQNNTAMIILLNIFTWYTRIKKKIENNSASEGVFYQGEWIKMNWSWVIFIFSLYAANAFELFCMAYLANIDRFLYRSNILF